MRDNTSSGKDISGKKSDLTKMERSGAANVASDQIASERISDFQLDGDPILCRRFGSGHINDSFLVVDDTARSYILQKINQNVFRDPLGVMRNIEAILSYLSQSGVQAGRLLELVPSNTGASWHVDVDGDYWRMYSFISDSVCYQRTENINIFRESAAAFGSFQKSLSDFPADTLYATIPRFHDTPYRYEQFHASLDADVRGRAKDAEREIEFALTREAGAGVLMERHAEGALPLRVTHNDTKLNNVLFDRRTLKNICVIDLDTVMPGFSVTDFGDSIRFGASTAAEDEKDLSKVKFSLRLFEAYAEGFLSACGSILNGDEVASLCDAARTITLENGVRFLSDYLSGDTYYRVSYDEHNLVRCRAHFKLVSDMERSREAMHSVIRRVMGGAQYSVHILART